MMALALLLQALSDMDFATSPLVLVSVVDHLVLHQHPKSELLLLGLQKR
jgi:hypothetical protein